MATSTTRCTLSNGTDSVEIVFNKLERDYDTGLAILSIPKSQDPLNACPESTTVFNPLNFNIDLLKLKQAITVTGWLLEEEGDTALTKLDKLEKILSGGTNYKAVSLSLAWKIGTKTITKYGSVIKVKITEMPGRTGAFTNTTQAKIFMVTLQFSVGVIKG